MRAQLIVGIVGLLATTVQAGEAEPVGIELVLALDSSASIDRQEFALQLNGLSAAFRDPDVLAAVESLKPLGAAVAVMQWGGEGESKTVIPWTRIADARDAKALAHLIGLIQRWQRTSSTSIVTAIDDSMILLDSVGVEGQRRVIDISGDGPDNGGGDLAAACRHACSSGVIVNGLAIEADAAGLASYYRENVVCGTGSFVETARDFGDFARAIKAKLLRELRPLES